MARYIPSRNGQLHLGQPHSFFPSYSILHISASCFTSFTTRLEGLVLVYGRVYPGPIRQKWPGSPRPKYETHSLWPNYRGTCFSPFLQHNTEGPISVMAGYILAPLAEFISTQGSGRWNMWLWHRGTKEQHTISAKKEGVDIWRSTDVQTPKKEGVDIWEVQTAKPQKRKELILEKYRRPNPKKEGVDLWQKYRRTKDKTQNGKSWSLTKTQKNNLSQ